VHVLYQLDKRNGAMKAKDVADLLQLSEDTVYRYARKGRIRPSKSEQPSDLIRMSSLNGWGTGLSMI
jgi:predicted DNA-binding transcriptional regulator AlpA